MTRQALVAYSVGLVGLILVKILAPGFYGQQNIGTPVKIAIVAVARRSSEPRLRRTARARRPRAAIGLGACLNAALLYRGLRAREIYRPQPGWGAFLAKVARGGGAHGDRARARNGAGALVDRGRLAPARAALAGLVLLGAAVYFGALCALGFRARDFVRQ